MVQAAATEFQTRGYFSTSMNVIAATANVSKRTLYNHFDSKEALFDAIIEELTQKAELLPVCSFDPTRDLREQLIELALVEVQFMTSQSVVALARAGISRVLAEPEVGKKIDHRRFHRRVEHWLDDAHAAGCLNHTNTEFAAKQFVGMLMTFAFWPTIVNGESPPSKKKRDRIVESTVEIFLASYQVSD
ncbi:TetR/AcrR family transcriptional regulator [Rhodopirellula bahusiensis]|uniref:TetR/AcrR family transcriptional regulator n=2 Tax=Rhodopirellula bahusiensis TaxID=2014065 RepID=UPI003D65CDAB